MPETNPSDDAESIVITGAGGQLGSQLCRLLGRAAIPLDLDAMDITDAASVSATLGRLRPAVVINTAAFTAVDDAETKQQLCHAVNHHSLSTLAEETERLGCLLVQLSTDYIFAGAGQRTPFREQDLPAPLGVYASSKADGEVETRRNARHLIVRTCGLYGPPCPNGTRNFVSTMLQLGQQRDEVNVVADQICNPTYVLELAHAILHLIRCEQLGTFHVVNGQPLTWAEFAAEIFRLSNLDCRVNPITTAEYQAKAPRPAYSVLDCSKYQSTRGPKLSSCREALAKFLANQKAAGQEASG